MQEDDKHSLTDPRAGEEALPEQSISLPPETEDELLADLETLVDGSPMAEEVLAPYKRDGLLPATLDYIFKRIFEGRLDCLASLLNAILGRSGSDKLEARDLKVLNPTQERRYRKDKAPTLDILVSRGEEETFDVEMQLGYRSDMRVRAFYYGVRVSSEQLKKGEDYDQLKPVVVIVISTFNVFPEYEDVHLCFRTLEQRHHFQLNNLLELHYVELGRFKSEKKSVDDALERWLLFLKGGPRELLEEAMEREPLIGSARARQQELSADERELATTMWETRHLLDVRALRDQERLKRKEIEYKRALLEKEQALNEKDKALNESRQALNESRQALNEKDKALAENAQKLSEADQALASAARGILELKFGPLTPKLSEALRLSIERGWLARRLPKLNTAETASEARSLLLTDE